MFGPKRPFKVNYEVIASCKCCGHMEKIPCTGEQWTNYMRREKCVQEIFPDVPSKIREMLVSGYCGICYHLDTGFPNITTEGLNRQILEILGGQEMALEEMPKDNSEVLEFLEYMEDYLDTDEDDEKEKIDKVRKLILERIDQVAKEMRL